MPGQVNSCDVTGLNPYHTYMFHVRGYDALGNVTRYLDPPQAYAISFRTLDQTPPQFNPFLTISGKPEYQLAWNEATDEQDPVGNYVFYQVYRKKGANFLDATNPTAELSSVEVNWLSEVATLNFLDGETLEENTGYYYTVCARDASYNVICPGEVAYRFAGDVTPPAISNFRTNKSESDKSWGLLWNLTDAGTDSLDLLVGVYGTITDSPETPAIEISNSLQYRVAGSTFGCDPECLFSNLQGPQGQVKYINYRIVVEDEEGNSSTSSTVNVLSDNVLEIYSVYPGFGDLDGGKLVAVRGYGFGTGAKIFVGDNECVSTVVSSNTEALCEAPAGTLGSKLCPLKTLMASEMGYKTIHLLITTVHRHQVTVMNAI